VDDLDLVRGKVERGEPLTRGELELLERAAASSSGPTLRLALAQALINAEQPREALRLLELLRRDFPRDLQTHLGHARALAALERWPEVEGALQAALALSPEDPEALKALALLALRRGERALAAQLVATVLRIDPLDGEARLIREELEAVEPALPPPDLAAFSGAVAAELRRRRVRHLARGEDVLLVRSGELLRVSLRSMHGSLRGDARPVAEVARRLVEDLLRLGAVGSGPDRWLGRVLPVLRSPEFAQQAPHAAQREGPAGLLVFYVLDHPELVQYLPRALADSAGVSLEALDEAAFRNLEARAVRPKLISSAEAPVWALAEQDGHDAARLLTRAQRELLRASAGEGPWRVDLGRREAAFVCQERRAEAVAVLETIPPAEDGLPGRYRLTDAGLERLPVSPAPPGPGDPRSGPPGSPGSG
jgi:tetratricopeptide (TPR) repeat protein